MEAILSPFTYTPVLPSMRSPLMSNSARLSMIDCSSYEDEIHVNAQYKTQIGVEILHVVVEIENGVGNKLSRRMVGDLRIMVGKEGDFAASLDAVKRVLVVVLVKQNVTFIAATSQGISDQSEAKESTTLEDAAQQSAHRTDLF